MDARNFRTRNLLEEAEPGASGSVFNQLNNRFSSKNRLLITNYLSSMIGFRTILKYPDLNTHEMTQ